MPAAPRAHRRLIGVRASALVFLACLAVLTRASNLGARAGQEQRPVRREFGVVASNYQFTPNRVVVGQGDIVKIRFRAEDIAHSFVVDDYRIAKRAGAGQTIEFEFRANRAGQFPVYCNLVLDERCSEMHGELVVDAR